MKGPGHPDPVMEQINKRMTLNLLIQGSAEHAFLTAHHLVAAELQQIHPQLLPLYDKLATGAYMTAYVGMNALIHGHPDRFWKRVDQADHPFHDHPFLRCHGPALAAAARVYTEKRAREKGMKLWPVIFSFHVIGIAQRILTLESPHLPRLEALARQVTSSIWGIDESRLDGTLTKNVAFGRLRKPTTRQEQELRSSAVGYGGVLRDGDQMRVVAKAWVWPLLTLELVKGVTELVCLHGLNHLSRDTYLEVIDTADHIEFEPWMIQAGSELWRLLLALRPTDSNLSRLLMNIARLSPPELDALMFAIVEQPDKARKKLEWLG